MKNISDTSIALPRRRNPRNRPAHQDEGHGAVRAAGGPDDVLAVRPIDRIAGPDPTSSQLPSATPHEIERLYAALSHVTAAAHPRTFKLLGSGTRKVAQKVIEEAGEVALEGVKRHPGGIVRESADLIYHLVVLWCRAGIDPQDVWREMRDRAESLGIAEKRPKPTGPNDKGSSENN
jgi:phosphoribosyl-ATP pyrophosphohydrolase